MSTPEGRCCAHLAEVHQYTPTRWERRGHFDVEMVGIAICWDCHDEFYAKPTWRRFILMFQNPPLSYRHQFAPGHCGSSRAEMYACEAVYEEEK